MQKNTAFIIAGLGLLLPLASFAISDPTGFSLISSGSTAQLSWTNPVDMDFDQVMIRRSEFGYPTTGDGALVTGGTMTNYDDTGLADGVHYYSIFAQDLSGNVSTGATGFAIIDTIDPTIIAFAPSGSLVSGVVYFTRDVEDEHINGGSLQLFISGDPNIFGLAYQNTIFPTDTGTTQTLTQVVGGLRDQVRYRSSIMIDGYGNQTTTPPTMFEVDGTYPTIEYTSPIQDGGSILLGEDAILTAQGSDTHLSGGHLHALIGTANNFDQTRPTNGLYHGGNTMYDTTGEGGITISDLPVGTYYRYARVTDIVGNYTSGAMQSFTVMEEPPHRSGGGGGVGSQQKNTSLFGGKPIPLSYRHDILILLDPDATPSDTGDYVTVAGFIRDVFALLGIPFHGAMPESYTTTPVSEALLNKIVKKLKALYS